MKNKTEIIQALQQAQEDTCSLHCPSVWRTGEKPPHSDRCKAVTAAIEKLQQQMYGNLPYTTCTDLTICLTPVIHREGNTFVGWVQEVPGANAQASTGDELRSALVDAVMQIIAKRR